MNIIGISAFYHESACCLLQDGQLVAAVEEERLTRLKHDRRLPINAFHYCLEAGRIGPHEVDCIAYYELPRQKLSRQLWTQFNPGMDPSYSWLDAHRPVREIRDHLGFEGEIRLYAHHLSHAASAFYYSGFEEAAVLTVDGVGEWATTTYALGRHNEIRPLEEVPFPHSLGLLYSTITDFLGFQVLSDEYKVMGLAPYGKPRFMDQMGRLVQSEPGGQFQLNLNYFDFTQHRRMYTDALCDLLGIGPREPESEILPVHQDIARSVQMTLENILLEKARYLHQITGCKNLCMAGGVALNCVANSCIRQRGPFEQMFVQPAATDAGSALGAAALAHVDLTGCPPVNHQLAHVYLGPAYSPTKVAHMLDAMGIQAVDYRGRESELLEAVVDRLVAEKVVGWFHGRIEFGPRALGARSILADPRSPRMRDHLNNAVKKREAFRPFAPAVLEHAAREHFDLPYSSPFMLHTCQVRSSIDLPAITHCDGSARPQTVDGATNPRFARLIERFYARTGCPILVNTSFNIRGEPIVCSPQDAVHCMANSQIDSLALEDFVFDKERLPGALREAVAMKIRRRKSEFEQGTASPILPGNIERWAPTDETVPERIYTFV